MLITLLVHTRAHRAAVLRKRCSCSSDVQRCCAFSARCCAFSTARCCAFSAARCCAFSTGGEEQMHCRARGKNAAPGHRVDMSSRLPPYFTQIKSNIPLLTRLCRGPWSPPMLHPAYRHHFSAFLDREALCCEDICKKCIDHTNTSHFATIRYHEPWIWPSTS